MYLVLPILPLLEPGLEELTRLPKSPVNRPSADYETKKANSHA